MQNHPNRADGGAMSVTRRSALRSLFAGTIAASTGMAIMATPSAEAAPVIEDAEVMALAREYHAAHREWLRAVDAECEVQDAYFDRKAMKPDQPKYPGIAGLRNYTLGEWIDGSIPHAADYDEEMSMWRRDVDALEKANAALRTSLGVGAAERAVRKASGKADRIGRKLMRTRARTPSGMLAKIRVQAKADFQDGILERELAKDLRAMMKAASAPTGGRA